MDLKTLVPEFKINSIQMAPLTHLEGLFNENNRVYNCRFGWIVLEANVILTDANEYQKINVSNDNILEFDGKKCPYALDLGNLYEPKKNSLRMMGNANEPKLIKSKK